jgi:hypothetical protein
MVNPKMVVRSGFGLYYMGTGWTFGNPLKTYGFDSAADYTSPNNGIDPAFLLSSGYPGSASLTATISPDIMNGQSGYYIEPSAGYMPYIEQWSLDVQYSPAPSWMVELAYVGNGSHRLPNQQFRNINQVDPKYLSLGSLLTVSASSTAAQEAGIQLPYPGFKGSVAQALRPFPQYQTLTSSQAKAGYSNYNAGQAVVEKRMSNGLRFSASYVYAKNMGINSPSWMDSTGDSVLQNAYDPAAEYSILPLSVTHALVFNYTYQLPFGIDRQFLHRGGFVNTLVGGWQISGIQRYQSGYPLPIGGGNDLPIFNRKLRPNVVPGVDRATHLSANEFMPASSRIVNPDAFSAPAPYTFGDARPTYSDVRTFPVYSEDLSASKSTRLAEGLDLNLGVNFFNAFNRHRFTSFSMSQQNSNFGQAISVSEPRYIQLNARVKF